MAAAAVVAVRRWRFDLRRLITTSAPQSTGSVVQSDADADADAKADADVVTTAATVAPPNPITAFKTFIRSSNDAEDIAAAFTRASTIPAFRRDRRVFSMAVEKLDAIGRPDLVEQVLELQTAFPTQSEGFWVRLISLYGKHGRPHLAARTFAAMADGALGSPRTDMSLSALLNAYLVNNQPADLHRAFAAAASDYGIVPSIASHNVVLAAHCAAKNLDAARKLLSKMERDEKVKPDIISYNTMLGAYLKEKDDAKFAELLQSIAKQGLDANVVTFNYQVHLLCRNGELSEANKLLLEVMPAKEIVPNTGTYNAVITGFCEEGNVEMAMEVFQKLVSNDSAAVPNAVTYHTLMPHLVAAGKLKEAALMCSESLKKRWVPSFSVMEGLVKALVKEGMVAKARAVVKLMKKKLQPSAQKAFGRVEKLVPVEEPLSSS